MGGGAQLAPMLSPELAFSPPKPKKKISDDVIKFLRRDDCCHGCALVLFLKMTLFKTDLIAPNSNIPVIEFCLLELKYSTSFNISVSQRATDENRGQLLSVLQCRGLPSKYEALTRCWADVKDSGLTLKQHWVNPSCLLVQASDSCAMLQNQSGSASLPRSHFLKDVIAGQSANGMRTLLQAWR